MTTQAVILAAGRGTRLGGKVNGDPKCLIPFGDNVLLEHQLTVLDRLGIDEVIVVVGHESDRVRQIVGDRCTYVVNDRFAETNSLYSLWTARAFVSGSFMLVNADVLAHPEVYRRVLCAGGTALAFDSGSGGEAEHMKVNVREGRLRAISKRLRPEETHGENLGILYFDEDAGRLMLREAAAIIEAGQLKAWAPAAVDRIADRVLIRAVDVADLPWTEIDFPEDLATANQTIWPAIAGENGHRNGAAVRTTASSDSNR